MAVPDFELIEGKYEILEKLREGGMGAVYKVRHRLLDELRVVKVIRPQLEGDEKLRDRFLHEARAAVRLRHPNIATLHDFTIDDDGVAFMVMEFINGEDLKRVVARETRLPVVLGLEVGLQTLRALKYLHSQGFIHRDISPDNLMLCRDPEERLLVKLIDLGVAKSLEASEELTRDGAFVGKFRYGAPEQFGGAGLQVDTRTDLYSLGVSLYEIFTGQHPFPGETEREIVGGHLFHPPRDFAETDPKRRMPEELRAVITRAMEKNAEDRFQSADEFGLAMRSIQDNFEDSGDEPFIELHTSEAGGSTGDKFTSTQRRLDHEFAPGTTPPPIEAVGVREKSGEGDLPEALGRGGRVSGSAWKLGLAGLVLAAVGVVAFLALGRGGEAEAPELVTPAADAPEVATRVEAVAAESFEPPPSPEPASVAADELPVEEEVADSSVTEADVAPPAPSPAPSGPSAAERRAEALVAEAQAFYKDGDDRSAFERARDALAADAGNAGAARLVREIASSAESRVARARRDAEAAGANGQSEFGSAAQAASAGAAHMAAGRAAEAVTAWWSSVDLFDRATRSAEEAARVARTAAQEEADRRADAKRQTTVDPRPAILNSLKRFAGAHRSLDIAALQAVWPSLSGDRLRALERSFAGAREIDMKIDGCVVQAAGGAATARCDLSQSYRPKRGTRQSIERQVTFQFIQRGEQWLIEDY